MNGLKPLTWKWTLQNHWHLHQFFVQYVNDETLWYLKAWSYYVVHGLKSISADFQRDIFSPTWYFWFLKPQVSSSTADLCHLTGYLLLNHFTVVRSAQVLSAQTPQKSTSVVGAPHTQHIRSAHLLGEIGLVCLLKCRYICTLWLKLTCKWCIIVASLCCL